MNATHTLKTKRSKPESITFHPGEVQNWVLTFFFFFWMRLENRVSFTGENKCFEISFQHTSGWKQIPWLCLFPVLTSRAVAYILPLLLCISHCLFAFKHANASLMSCYETSPTSHSLPSLSPFLMFLPLSVLQLLKQTVLISWLLFSRSTFAPVFHLLCELAAQHWASPSQLLFES